MTIKPIRSEADYEVAVAAIAERMDAQPGTEEFDQLDILATLIEAYEQKHYPISAPDPISAIQHHMDAHSMTRRDIEALLNCTRGRVSELLSRKRPLTLGMIRKIHEQWGGSLEILIRDYAMDDEPDDAKTAAPLTA